MSIETGSSDSFQATSDDRVALTEPRHHLPSEGSEQAVTIEVEDSSVRIPLQRAAGDERSAMGAVAVELHVEFPSVPIDQLTILVECLWTHFEGAAVRDFVPLLVRKQAKEELLDHLGPQGTVSPRGIRPQ